MEKFNVKKKCELVIFNKNIKSKILKVEINCYRKQSFSVNKYGKFYKNIN